MAKVSYITEIKRFVEYAAANGLSDREFRLWHVLMDIFNRHARGSEWPDDFIPITNGQLMYLMHLKKEDALYTPRETLCRQGLIEFIKGNRNKVAARYKINYFYPVNDDVVPKFGGNIRGNIRGNIGGKNGDVYKDYIDLDEYSDVDEGRLGDIAPSDDGGGFISAEEAQRQQALINAVLEAARYAGMALSMQEMDTLTALISQYGAEAVKAAIGTASSRGKVNTGYISGILAREKAEAAPDKPVSRYRDWDRED